MNWEKKSSENRFEGKGNENKVTFAGLPLNNNDFGVKMVYLDVRGFNYFYNMALDNIWVKIFFPKEAKNHPYPLGSQPNTPNWYYYWGQEEPSLTDRYYDSQDQSPIGSGHGEWLLKADYSTEIKIYDVAKISFYYCTKTMAHENQHERDWQIVWPNGYDKNKDSDNDGLDDEWEISNCDICRTHCSGLPSDQKRHWEDYSRWSQQRAEEVENNYPNKSSSKDWASPGTNY